MKKNNTAVLFCYFVMHFNSLHFCVSSDSTDYCPFLKDHPQEASTPLSSSATSCFSVLIKKIFFSFYLIYFTIDAHPGPFFHTLIK